MMTYAEMLTQIQRLTNNVVTQSVMIDSELRMLGALTQIYPVTPQIGRLCHLPMNVFKHVRELGLQQVYLNDQLFRTNIRMIPVLSFVANVDTVAAFDQHSNHCGALEQPVLDYFETYYIGELRRGRRFPPLFPHELWNMHTRVQHDLPRTNNVLEGWHNRFCSMFTHSHPSIWEFIEAL